MSDPTPIVYRMARLEDSREVARFICMAGGGVYEFLFDDLIPFVTARDVLAIGVGGDHFPISHRNCCVATAGDGGPIVGAANAFPADLLKSELPVLFVTERQQHIRPMLELQDWGSMFLNSLAVADDRRGGGIGEKLLAWAETRAAQSGFDRLSLHVWADNTSAIEFYAARRFVEIGVADVAFHPRLQHSGGSVLMRKAIAAS